MERTLISETLSKIGEEVKLQGWAENVRRMGKLTFIEIRDRSGKVQAMYESKIESLPIESVIEIIGVVKERPASQVDAKLETGTVEIEVKEFKVLNKALSLPIPINTDGYEISEEMRLKYRYLDLRRDRLHKVLELRSKFIRAVREAMYEQDFIEVETPILTASTKEGARDMVVPSRMNPGNFYALPQSPQQYKQLLMTAGVEKYFQVARCFRDENLRADRGFEFTQIDIEMSFVKEEDVMKTMQTMVQKSVKAVGGKIREGDFPVLTFDEVIEKYGDDKFDIRTEEEKENGVLAFAFVHRYPMYKKVDTEDVAEVRDGKSGWTFTHNPFSGIKEDHREWQLSGTNLDRIEATQYDLICNGFEMGSGSIRNHEPEMLKATYRNMGYSEEETIESLGHMLKAFELGTPPHGGMALGIDRLVMLLAGEKSLKETIAFPMTYQGRTSIMGGPSALSEEILEDLGLSLRQKESVLNRLLKYLENSKVEFKHLTHESTPTSEDAARVRITKLEEGIKALILRGKKTNKNYMVAIPANLKLDTKAVKQVVGEDVEFEKPEKIKEKYDLEVGGVPPFGNLLEIETYYDEKIFTEVNSAFNSGTKTDSVIMKSVDLKNVIPEMKVGRFGV